MHRAVTALLIAATMLGQPGRPGDGSSAVRRGSTRQGRDHRRTGRIGADAGLHLSSPSRPPPRPRTAARRSRGRSRRTRRRREVLAAVEDANIVVYFGHGIGSPNPYSEHPERERGQRLGLNGPNPSDDHADSVAERQPRLLRGGMDRRQRSPGTRLGDDLLERLLRPWRGRGLRSPRPTRRPRPRVSAPTRAARLPTSAHRRTSPPTSTAAQRSSSRRCSITRTPRTARSSPPSRAIAPDAVTVLRPHPVPGAETGSIAVPYFEGLTDYWYAFAGDPTASLSGAPISVARSRSSRAGSRTCRPRPDS